MPIGHFDTLSLWQHLLRAFAGVAQFIVLSFQIKEVLKKMIRRLGKIRRGLFSRSINDRCLDGNADNAVLDALTNFEAAKFPTGKRDAGADLVESNLYVAGLAFRIRA